MLVSFKKIWQLFSLKRKIQFFLVFGLMVAGGFSEAVSLGAVVPFLAAMATPEKMINQPLIHNSFFLQNIFKQAPENLENAFRFNPENITFYLGAGFIVAAIVAGGIRLLLIWCSARLAYAAGAELSYDIYRMTLHQPYTFHISNNTSEIVSILTAKVGFVIVSLSYFLMLATSFVISISLVGVLIVFSSKIFLWIGLSICFVYGLIIVLSKSSLIKNSKIIAQENPLVIKALQEGLGGVRDIILDGTQETFCKEFGKSDKKLRRANADLVFVGHYPRYLMESCGLVIFALITIFLVREPAHFIDNLPVLGLVALGVQRLLPTIQQGYNSAIIILGYKNALNDVLWLLEKKVNDFNTNETQKINFKKNIRFNCVGFKYQEKGPWILKGLNLSISRGERVGFVGKTGSGKSTCLDLLMGLLKPTEGEILIDGQPLGQSNIRSWQRNIAHVPQAIFLSDTTLAQNIAFGVPEKKIDMHRIRAVARQARIADFIESSPKGYEALVGERGIRLSGGQRQRIGIARALYKEAEILVFDEATSALDSETEEAVMQSIELLSDDLTILIIAHRTSTLKNCTQIIDFATTSTF